MVREKKRLAVAAMLSVTTIASEFVSAFTFPDETWASRWLNHPLSMSITLLLAVACCLVAWWPRRKSG